MASLTVLLNEVAAIREMMQMPVPNPTGAALLAETAGADGISLYLREDHHPVTPREVQLLRHTYHGKLVLHIPANSEMVSLALEIKPQRVVIMPNLKEDRDDEPGLDMVVGHKIVIETVDTLQSHGISVGICVVPEPEQVKGVHQSRANWVQFHAGKMAAAATATAQAKAFNRMMDAVKMAHRLRLHIAVGHGLDYQLIKLFKGLEEVDEFSVGRCIVARAVSTGMDRAVRDMVALVRGL